MTSTPSRSHVANGFLTVLTISLLLLTGCNKEKPSQSVEAVPPPPNDTGAPAQTQSPAPVPGLPRSTSPQGGGGIPRSGSIKGEGGGSGPIGSAPDNPPRTPPGIKGAPDKVIRAPSTVKGDDRSPDTTR